MKVAIATQDMARINAHLGWAQHLMFFDVSEEGYAYLNSATFGSGQQDGDHGKLVLRLDAVRGCNLIFAADIGPEGERGLARVQVVPIRQFANQPVALALEALRDELRGRVPIWLRKLELRARNQEPDEETNRDDRKSL
jgi:nitrogen fixation protein NifX